MRSFGTKPPEGGNQSNDPHVHYPCKKTSSIPSNDVGKHLLKTKMCSLYLKGKCHYGADRCFYAHNSDELREKPQLSKTSYCASFKSGSCERGATCNYAHDMSELTISSKNVKCLWHNSGKCSHGAACRFSHAAPVPPFSPSCATTTSNSIDDLDDRQCQVCGMASVLSGQCLCKVFKDCSAILELL